MTFQRQKSPTDGLSILPLGLNALSHSLVDMSYDTNVPCKVPLYCSGGGG